MNTDVGQWKWTMDANVGHAVYKVSAAIVELGTVISVNFHFIGKLFTCSMTREVFRFLLLKPIVLHIELYFVGNGIFLFLNMGF